MYARDWRQWILKYGYRHEKFRIYQLWNSPTERKQKNTIGDISGMQLSINLCLNSYISLLTYKKKWYWDHFIYQVQVSDFVKEFIEKTHEYVHHVNLTWWNDEKFWISRDTFTHGTILLVVDFAENYTLQPQNEIQI